MSDEDRKLVRAEALRKLAVDYGLGFSEGPIAHRSRPGVEPGLPKLDRFWPFSRDDAAVAENLFHGQIGGLDWWIFDYFDATVQFGAVVVPAALDEFGVICVQLPVNLPRISVQVESFLHRLMESCGLRHISFECEEFNRVYFVNADDARATYDILHPQAIDYLLEIPPRHWQMGDSHLLVVRRGRYEPQEIPQLIDEIGGFVRLIPGYVLEDRAWHAAGQGSI